MEFEGVQVDVENKNASSCLLHNCCRHCYDNDIPCIVNFFCQWNIKFNNQ